jgi:hypothetical protein
MTRQNSRALLRWTTNAAGAVLASLASAIPAVTAQAPQDVLIQLERKGCGGGCPVYSVTIDGEGVVTYDGGEFARVAGRQTDRIPVSAVTAILDTAERVGFFGLRNQYRVIENPDGTETHVTDLETAVVTITANGRSKQVEDYLLAPEGLKQLEREIDSAARTKRWTFIDELELARLRRDGWSPGVDELGELLRIALGYDDLPIVKALLDLGANPNHTYYGTGTSALMIVHSAAAARLLLDAGANPLAQNQYNGTPLAAAAHLDPAVADMLLRAGARPDVADVGDGRTPLWEAAAFGNAGVVALLLGAGANPSVVASGHSVLEVARVGQTRERTVKPSVLNLPLPYVRDFDRTIDLLERALERIKRR